ncbi:hypothetical protein HQ346_17190 [Rhodococcus sp. BP-252]|uniref:hypothetical protein n=1 Tax=unclassified Rhodococcus (in: high G+C Gram-positive bacteria) TaxID=192944 RepID=UPI0014314E74|nr:MULTISPECIES: hypothetical protein [unclassified Rhodococcus (in: high G+C Gram-positive bacteria)]MBY6413433.1 hypothetical protein [Rhodococcus sp. BP-320]MBY6418127.1 hypothetical protein [Rhodococcus sp. BP-321]MBY6422392.1 hypothetical protein [Rhodococcus sp. BP-324]MBY6428627.1 hypothetical protein [Rhodococcus sp. BP-323]MBY6433633.1 hypothetical protein [Rhodococcus sp. BP-322]
MTWSRVRGSSVALGAVCAVLGAATSACGESVHAATGRCSDAGVSSVRVTGDEPPEWADHWVSRSDGSIGGGSVTPGSDYDTTFDNVYSCVGLTAQKWNAMAMGNSTMEQRAVRVGVDDYYYRAGDVTIENRSYAVDVVVAQMNSDSARFGVAFSPLSEPRPLDDVYGGAFVVQRMREAGVF